MASYVDLVYLATAVLFILGIKRLSSPATARAGNQMAAIGMLVGVVATLLVFDIVNPVFILVGVVIGGGVGAIVARTVAMTAMPEMVALLNGFGGAASQLVASAELLRLLGVGPDVPANVAVSVTLSTVIGGVTFSGSLVAFGKLRGIVSGRAVTFPLQKPINALLFLAILVCAVLVVVEPGNMRYFAILHGLALVFGIMLVIPIGGADMPVVISLLNSYSGVAAATTGFVINNYGLIISGALVGASGLVLTRIMCKAMNRSLGNVLFGAFGAQVTAGVGGDGKGAGQVVRQITVEDAAVLLGYARLAIVVPGYGLAVAQAQHEVREMADLIEKNGGEVKYAIHPVAGRMPGHMNVLLAEANVPYEKLHDMDAVNPEFERADVALVVGANDVVNPAARSNPASPIYGMPILDVDKAKQIIVLKRSMNPGFAGIENELFYDPKTSMLFGDAKDSLGKLVSELKSSS
jgi:NAD(P) transhydrogenase subunit beta